MATALGAALTTADSAAGRAPDAGKFPADVHSYLEDPEKTGEGQEPPHTRLKPTGADAEKWQRSLDGSWRFALADKPEDAPAGFWKEDYDASSSQGFQRVKVPHTWQTDDLDHPIFRNIDGEIVPEKPPKVPRDVNPTGAYLRDVQVPKSWDGRRQVLRFDGMTSAAFVWVNGRYVGYDQGGYVPAEFDVTDYLRPGHNRVAVQVHRWSAGSYLEDYDQWRFAGIFRSVSLYSTPKTRMEDAYVTTDLDAAYRDATLPHRGRHRARRGRDEGEAAGHGRAVRPARPRGAAAVRRGGGRQGRADGGGEEPRQVVRRDTEPVPAGAEAARRRGKVTQTVRQSVGFREVEVKDKQLKLNGKRILIRGVNRAETDPTTGRYATRERMEQDVRLMKRLNVNAIRTSHYPSDPYLYELADREGILIDDEMEVETHSFENCPDDCLAEKPEWQKAFLERHQGMVERDKNHPSVIMWDTGNEAGLGKAHYTMAEWTKKNEPTRPLYHQPNRPDGDAPFADIAGPDRPPERCTATAGATADEIAQHEPERQPIRERRAGGRGRALRSRSACGIPMQTIDANGTTTAPGRPATARARPSPRRPRSPRPAGRCRRRARTTGAAAVRSRSTSSSSRSRSATRDSRSRSASVSSAARSASHSEAS